MLSRHFYQFNNNSINSTTQWKTELTFYHFSGLSLALLFSIITKKWHSLVLSIPSFSFFWPTSSLLCIPYLCSLGSGQQQAPSGLVSGLCTGRWVSTVLSSPIPYHTEQQEYKHAAIPFTTYASVYLTHAILFSKSNYSGHEINSNFVQILVWNGLRLFKLL